MSAGREVVARGVWTVGRDLASVREAVLRTERWVGLRAERTHIGGPDGVGGTVRVDVPTGRRATLTVDAEVAEVAPWRVVWHLAGDLVGSCVLELDALDDVTDVRLDLRANPRRGAPAVAGSRRRVEAAVVRAVARAGRGLAAEADAMLHRSVTLAPGGHRRHAVGGTPRLALRS